MTLNCDVAIIGGGPAGSTTACVLKMYAPELKVAIFEREIFPRDHVGESLLPRVCKILHDIGCWDEMEAQGFAIKVGATYRWGNTRNLWHFDFLPEGKLKDQPRPGKFEGQRARTAFQVDRSLYDKVLLDRAAALGAEVYQDVKVVKVETEGDRVLRLVVSPEGEAGQEALRAHTIGNPGAGIDAVQARYYVDASGSSGLLRRAFEVPTHSPTSLRNIAIWDYWQNAEWAEHIGIEGTRIQVLSLGWGWIWFIPLGPTRTSVGLVIPADHLKSSGKRPEELYRLALDEEPDVKRLLANATREGKLNTTKDWNYISSRLTGENWFLAGDSAGFADPILSAGLTLAQGSAVKVADTILELDRGKLEPAWLKSDYDETQRAQINNHISFADYWYSANGCFTELKEYCAEIAKNSGLNLDAETAFAWLGTGGFAHDNLGAATSAHCHMTGTRHNIDQMAGHHTEWAIEKYNVFRLNTEGAEEVTVGSHTQGRITPVRCLKRGPRLLPLYLAYGSLYAALKQESEIQPLLERFVFEFRKEKIYNDFDKCFWLGCEMLEAMVWEEWVQASFDPVLPRLKIVGTPTINYYGWWKEGVGMIAVNPAARASVVLDLDRIAELEGRAPASA